MYPTHATPLTAVSHVLIQQHTRVVGCDAPIRSATGARHAAEAPGFRAVSDLIVGVASRHATIAVCKR
jgi:hypothetical protein